MSVRPWISASALPRPSEGVRNGAARTPRTCLIPAHISRSFASRCVARGTRGVGGDAFDELWEATLAY